MRKIIIRPAEESRRRASGGAIVGVIAIALVFFAASRNKPPVPLPPRATVTETVTVTVTITVPPENTSGSTGSSGSTGPPLPARLEVNRQQLSFNGPALELVRISNAGEEPLAIDKPVSPHASFRLSSDCDAPLGKSDQCVVAVAYDDTVAGSMKTSLRIASNGGDATVALIGNARRIPVVELKSLDFGKRAVGSTGETQSARFTNSSPLPINVGNASVPAPFHLVQDGCAGAKVAPGGNCDVVVDFDPTAPGVQSGELRIVAVAGNVIGHAAVSGYAYVQPPVKLVMNPPQIDFGMARERRIQTINVTNPGPRPAVIRGVQLVPPKGPFNIDDNCHDRTLAPNDKPCVIRVVLMRPAMRGGEMAKVVITYEGGQEIAGGTAHQAQ